MYTYISGILVYKNIPMYILCVLIFMCERVYNSQLEDKMGKIYIKESRNTTTIVHTQFEVSYCNVMKSSLRSEKRKTEKLKNSVSICFLLCSSLFYICSWRRHMPTIYLAFSLPKALYPSSSSSLSSPYEHFI